MSRGLWGAILVVLVLAGGSALFFQACEKQTRSIYTGFQGEAATNRYLAAQRMLEAMGSDLRRLSGFDGLDELSDAASTLILPINRNRVLGEERSAALLDWVRRGGHLIVVTWSLWDDENRDPDFILDPLDVRQYMWDEEDFLAEDDADPQQAEAPDEGYQLALVEFPDRAEPLAAEFDSWFYLVLGPDQSAEWQMSDPWGPHLLTVREGLGYVTTATDDYLVANDTIGNHDHAELLFRLVHRYDRGGEVWLVTSATYPSAWALLFEHAWMAVASLLLLIAAWVWARSTRFGPVRPDDPLDRRSLMEHIEATGRFQLRHRAQRDLTESVRQALLARVRERHPAWLALDPAALNARLAQLTEIPRERVDRALGYRSERDPERFAQRIATLERIRKAL